MYQTENHNEHEFNVMVDGHAVAKVTRFGRRVEGDNAAGWAVDRGLPMENHLTDDQWRRLVALVSHAPELLAAIDQCAASLENCVLHYGGEMSEGDRHSRGKNAEAAREAQAHAEGFRQWEDALAAWCDE